VTERKQFSSFFVDGLFFGIEVAKVQEVMGAVYMTPVPLAPPAVRGLINLRGQIVTSIDLRCCLQLNERPADQVPVNLILYTDDGCTSLLVDDVGEVLEVDETTFEPPPETLQGRPRELIRGAYKLDNRLMHVLDVERTLNFAR
jgi:purine-binding chemotaxis protein CheW